MGGGDCGLGGWGVGGWDVAKTENRHVVQLIAWTWGMGGWAMGCCEDGKKSRCAFDSLELEDGWLGDGMLQRPGNIKVFKR